MKKNQRVEPQAVEQMEPLAVDQETAARLIGVSPSTLRRWTREGRGPRIVRISGVPRYRPDDLRSFVNAGTQ